MAEYAEKSEKRPEGLEREALANWNLGVESWQNQLDREIEDLRLQVPDMQWDEGARKSRQGAAVDGLISPPRPCLAVPKTEQPIRLILNQMQSSHMGVGIHPLSEDADDDTAEVYADLYRSIERDPDAPAQQARYWGFDRSTRAGRGWYRVTTAYDESTPDPFDQKILIERILHQSSVVIDPSATRADYSDARWAFISAWVPWSRFKQEYPDSVLVEADSASPEGTFDLCAMTDQTPDWVKINADSKAVQVAEYFCKKYKPKTITAKDGRKRTTTETTLMRYVLGPGGEDGLQILDEMEWYGPDIPLIPCVGNELQPFDDERRIFGMYRPMRDSAQIFNFAATTLVERTAMEPKAPYTLDPRQIEGYEQAWAQANTRNFPYLPAKLIIDGQAVSAPQRTAVDTSALMPSVLLLQQADQFIQSASSTPDAVLGKDYADKSGKAIKALQGQSEASTSNYLQNFADITMRYEAKVVMGMIPKIYDRPGRIAQVLNDQGEIRKVMLNMPYTETPDKKLVPAPQLPGGMTTTAGKPAPKPKFYDFSKGIYGVAITIGKTFQSRKEAGQELLISIMEKDPQLGVVLSPLLLRFMDGPGMKEAAELAKEFRDKQFPGIGQPKDGTETPEMLKSQVQQMQAEMEQMRAAGQKMQQALETKEVETQAKIQAAEIAARAKAESEQSKAQTEAASAAAQAELEVRLQEMKAESDREIAAMKEQAETQRLLLEQKFAAIQAELNRQAADRAAERNEANMRESESREE